LIIKCAVCSADPAGRWVQPPACIFVDHVEDTDEKGQPSLKRVYSCRARLSPKREAEIAKRPWSGELR
jgi:hypothetical protein